VHLTISTPTIITVNSAEYLHANTFNCCFGFFSREAISLFIDSLSSITYSCVTTFYFDNLLGYQIKVRIGTDTTVED
jgi:hypothetical protein